jgi:hypothetical protein
VDLGDGAQPALADDHHIDSAIEHLFQQAEFFAAGEDASRLGGIFAQLTDDPNSPAATGEGESWRGKAAAVEGVGGAQNPEEQLKPGGIIHASQGWVILSGGYEPAMSERQVNKGAALLFVQREVGVSPNHASAERGMFSFVDGTSDIVDECRHFDEANVGARQIMKREGDVNEGRDVGGDPALVANIAELIGGPVSEPGKL